MPVRYLLDTSMASYVIKGNFPRVRERLLKVPMTEVGISSVTEAELRFGVAKRPDAGKLKVAVEEFLIRVETLPWDSEAAKHYAAVRAALEKDGTPMGNMDMMIASQALAAEAMLITHDRCLGERGIEDWARH
ncbi:MAG TPA: type II toxin-antitoxin system VapC family toxin [Terriglobales bacterium]|nr:type II toxin-antitoxin system VapC family toxin [Terriglobales bacterium]